MNYGVYTYQVVDGIVVCRFYAYRIVSTEAGRGIAMMTQADAEALAAGMGGPGSTLTKMVLPLESFEAITASS